MAYHARRSGRVQEERSTFGFDLLAIRFPNLGKNILFPLASILTIFTVSILIWFSITQIRIEIDLDTMTEALNIPHWLYTLAIPSGGILIIIRIIEAACKELKEGKD